MREYLNQKAVWRKVIGRDAFTQPVFADPISIQVRWEGKRRLVRDTRGQEVVSEARVFCLEAVQPGDKLEYGGRAWTVIAVNEIPDLAGVVVLREVAV